MILTLISVKTTILEGEFSSNFELSLAALQLINIGIAGLTKNNFWDILVDIY